MKKSAFISLGFCLVLSLASVALAQQAVVLGADGDAAAFGAPGDSSSANATAPVAKTPAGKSGREGFSETYTNPYVKKAQVQQQAQQKAKQQPGNADNATENGGTRAKYKYNVHDKSGSVGASYDFLKF